jgi:hypothetical protein
MRLALDDVYQMATTEASMFAFACSYVIRLNMVNRLNDKSISITISPIQ